MKRTIKFIAYTLPAIVLMFLSCKKENSCKNCQKPPIAKAGPDHIIALPTDSVLLDGNASSDPDGTISAWLWTKISGPASFVINNASAAKIVVNKLTAGIYQFELKVTDAGGLFSKDTVQIKVNPASSGKTINARVVEYNTGKPVSGALVSLRPDYPNGNELKLISDQNGSFSFVTSTNNIGYISVEKAGYWNIGPTYDFAAPIYFTRILLNSGTLVIKMSLTVIVFW